MKTSDLFKILEEIEQEYPELKDMIIKQRKHWLKMDVMQNPASNKA